MKKILLVLCAFVSGACGASSSGAASSSGVTWGVDNLVELAMNLNRRHIVRCSYGVERPIFEGQEELPAVARAYEVYPERVSLLETKHRQAEEGCPKAQFEIACAYYYIRFIPHFQEFHHKWLNAAVAQGYCEAQFFLGLCVLGEDEKKGIGLIRKASDKGYAPAQYFIGQLTVDGLGVAQKKEEGLRLFRVAALAGYQPAQTQMGVVHDPRTADLLTSKYRKILYGADKWISDVTQQEMDYAYSQMFYKYTTKKTAKSFGVDVGIVKDVALHPSQRLDHAVIGVCPFIDYFTQDKIEKLIEWSFASFKKVTFFIPVGWSRFNLMATGMCYCDATDAVEVEDNRLKTVLMEAFGKVGISQEDAMQYICFGSDLEKNEQYLEMYRNCIERYDHDEAFRTSCRDISSGIIKSQDPKAIEIAVLYLLKELPLFFGSARFFNVDASYNIYHKMPGFMEFVTQPRQGFIRAEIKRR